MATVYYAAPGGVAINDEPARPALTAPLVPVSHAAYLTELVGNIAALNPETYGLSIQVSRSKKRTNAVPLKDDVLDTGKTYAIFIPDVVDFAYSQVVFKLDGSTVNTEASAPWDYATTAGSGDAVLTTIPAGSHTIAAVVTYPGGTLTISAAFEVN